MKGNLKSFLWRDTFRHLLHSMEKKKAKKARNAQTTQMFIWTWYIIQKTMSSTMKEIQAETGVMSRSSRTSTGLLGEFRIAALEVPTLRRLLSSSSSLIGKACHCHTIRHHGFTSSSLSWPPLCHDYNQNPPNDWKGNVHMFMIFPALFDMLWHHNCIVCHVLSCHNPPHMLPGLAWSFCCSSCTCFSPCFLAGSRSVNRPLPPTNFM